MSVTGTYVRSLRHALGMEPGAFAQLLGVHPSTLYRWEAAGDAILRMEPFQQQILAVAEQHVASQGPQSSELGNKIVKGLMLGGAMLGLYKLLEAAFQADEPRRTGGAVARGTKPRTRSSPTKKRKT